MIFRITETLVKEISKTPMLLENCKLSECPHTRSKWGQLPILKTTKKKTLKVKHFKNYQQRLQSDVKGGRMLLVTTFWKRCCQL